MSFRTFKKIWYDGFPVQATWLSHDRFTHQQLSVQAVLTNSRSHRPPKRGLKTPDNVRCRKQNRRSARWQVTATPTTCQASYKSNLSNLKWWITTCLPKNCLSFNKSKKGSSHPKARQVIIQLSFTPSTRPAKLVLTTKNCLIQLPNSKAGH